MKKFSFDIESSFSNERAHAILSSTKEKTEDAQKELISTWWLALLQTRDLQLLMQRLLDWTTYCNGAYRVYTNVLCTSRYQTFRLILYFKVYECRLHVFSFIESQSKTISLIFWLLSNLHCFLHSVLNVFFLEFVRKKFNFWITPTH